MSLSIKTAGIMPMRLIPNPTSLNVLLFNMAVMINRAIALFSGIRIPSSSILISIPASQSPPPPPFISMRVIPEIRPEAEPRQVSFPCTVASQRRGSSDPSRMSETHLN